MKTKILYLLLTLSSLSLMENITAQYLPDGTFGTSEYIDEIVFNLEEESKGFFDTTHSYLNVNLSIEFFIVKDESGQNNIEEYLIDESIITLNSYFSPIGISFNKGAIEYVNEYEYSYIRGKDSNVELLTKYADPSKINVFLVEWIELDSMPYYAYTHFPTDSVNTNIFIQKNNMSAKNLTTQMAHFLGLLSTHERFGGIELIDSSNCSMSGDYLCGTYADPGLYYLINNECLYEGTAIDPNSDFYVPSVANLMSDSPEACKCIFTLDQYRRMYFYYNKYRHNILSK